MEDSNRTIFFEDVLNARENISKSIHKTPVFTNRTINNITGRSIFFKAENLQKTGSFKARGALNTILKLVERKQVNGLVTSSSGNHGQAVAWAANTVGLPCSVVIPRHAPLVKKEAIKDYGASLIECGSEYMDRVTKCQKVVVDFKYDLIPSSDHPHVIAGQILKLVERKQVNGLVTSSSGNHGQAVAWAANTVGLPCSVVIPRHAPLVKKEAIKDYGASLIECGSEYMDRVTKCQKVVVDFKYDLIPSSDHPHVIAGQGTIGLEFLEAIPNLDALFVSVGGGGMIAGIAIVAKHLNPGIKVFAVEPEGKILEKCLKSGNKLWPDPPQYLDTIADGLMGRPIADDAWPYILENVEKEVFTVNNEEIVKAMQFVFERMKLVVETSAAATVAAVMSDQFKKLDGSIQNVGVILCGGNADIHNLPW